MSEYEKDTEFLRQCLLYGDSAERYELEEGIMRIQRDERCVRRAVWLMALVTGLAMAGLGYAAVFLMDSSQIMTQLTSLLITKVFCVLGIGSLVCMLTFLVLGVVYRKELDQRREECRRFALKLFEARLGQPQPRVLPSPEALKEASL
jgi:hypothetical protein